MSPKKNKSKNMDLYKNLFFEVGLVVALFIVLAAFEWKTTPASTLDINSGNYVIMENDTIITIDQKTPPPPAIKPKTTEIEITKKEVDTPDDIFTPEDTGGPSGPVIQFFPEPTHEAEVPDTVILIPPIMPEFAGGEAGLKSFLLKNIHYPKTAIDAGIYGTVYVTFIIEKNGAVSNVELARGIGSQCDAEAMRVVSAMPAWSPGKNSLGRPVRTKMTLPVRFVLAN
jgi:protein TonB